jgi:ferritin-like metal-binding protein YciE
MSVGTLEELLIDESKDLYSTKKQILRSSPKPLRRFQPPDLQQGLTNHLEETKNQVGRLEKIGEILGTKMTVKTCVRMKGALEEGFEVLEDAEKGWSATLL